ncbi:MAG: hypothetical protein ACP5JJ_05815, partial [Anaerolineae bacterium]
HSLSALIFAPVLLVYLALLLIRAGNRRALGAVATALVLAVALSVFYWLPVLAESRFVGLGSGASQGYRDHLVTLGDLLSLDLAYPYPAGTGVTPAFPLGLFQIAVLVAAAFLALRRGPWQSIVLFFLGVGLLSAFMLTSLSEPVWRLLEPALAFLQYPWRFQALTVLATAFLAGALSQALPAVPRASLAAAAGCLLVAAWALWRLPFSPTVPSLAVEAMWQQDRDHGQVGATWTGEYLPVWVQEQRWAISLPLAEPAQSGVCLPSGQVQLGAVGYTSIHMALDMPRGGTVTLHQFHYPGWQARWQGETIASRPEGALGLATFDLASGRGPLDVHLAGTPAQRWGTLISLVTFLILSLGLVARPRLSRPGPAWRA